jgi:hypothetical protein
LREATDGWDDDAALPNDRGHEDPQPVAGDGTLLRARRGKIRQAFQPVAGSLGAGGGTAYQIYLASTGISWAGFNVAVSALRFFYGVTLGCAAMVERIPYARKQQQLPVILSAEEVMRFFAAVPSLKNRTALMTAYAPACGSPKSRGCGSPISTATAC